MMHSICKHCGKQRGSHQAKTSNCPVGSKSKIGYTTYHQVQTFEAKPNQKKYKGFTL